MPWSPYHDENGNDQLDTDVIGYPIEGYALSNGIRAVVARLRFSDASFPVGPAGCRVALHVTIEPKRERPALGPAVALSCGLLRSRE